MATPKIISAVFRNASTARRSSASTPSSDDGIDGGPSSSSCSAFAAGDQRQLPFERTPDQHARNQQPVDLVRAFEDAVDARVAIMPLGGVIPDVAIAAVDLDVLVEDVVERLAPGDLRNRRLDVTDSKAASAAEPSFASCGVAAIRASTRPAVR